ncbi:hypothetical protein scyTo_0000860 [Scyliorhinus torazame]|uniref:Uncharacterized protein n=1 Tax=Scyliorhinus torazame TaxID=75743 RepID=A0A401P5B1_SCYTO|nr:hypothetical protein [Scyliorhinus torazame]
MAVSLEDRSFCPFPAGGVGGRFVLPVPRRWRCRWRARLCGVSCSPAGSFCCAEGESGLSGGSDRVEASSRGCALGRGNGKISLS